MSADSIVRDLLGDAAEGRRGRVPALFENHSGNAREALREVYGREAGIAP